MQKIINTKTSTQISKRKQEDLTVLDKVDDILKGRRSFLAKIPEEGSPVIACVSGGMDSIANWAILLEEFKLEVYPFFINRGQTNYKWEKEAIEYFDKFFQKKYPKLHHNTLEVKIKTPPTEYKTKLRNTKNMKDNSYYRKTVAYPARNPIISLIGMEYGYSLQNEGVFPKTVFVTFLADDPPKHSTLTSIRITNLLICHIMDDYNWQLISIPLEREIGNYYAKIPYVKWCQEHDIPLEKTRSCYKDQEYHCGVCEPACINRKKAFKEAGIKDKTIYKQ